MSKKTALAANSDETGMNIEDESYCYGGDQDEDDCDYLEDEDEYLFYRKEKWNPNSPINPMYKTDTRHYDDDDVSLNMEDIFPTCSTGSHGGTAQRRTNNNHNSGSHHGNSGSCDSISITDEITNHNNASLLFGRNMKRIDLLHGTHNLNVDYDFDEDTSNNDDSTDSIHHIIHGNHNDSDDDDDDLLLPPNHTSDKNDEDDTNSSQPPQDIAQATLKSTNSNSSTNNSKSSKLVTAVSLQDYLERPSKSNVVASTTGTARGTSPLLLATKTTIAATTASVTSSTMDNTSWNDESCSSCCASQVL